MKYLVSLCVAFTLCAALKLSKHVDDLDAINEDFPYRSNNEALDEESVVLGRDEESGCICRQYFREKYVTCYDPVNCTRFPRRVRFRTKTVRISTTGITVLQKDDFFRNTDLTTFKLESNDALRRIEPGAFNGLSRLVNLTITHNKNLLHLDNETFTGLHNLSYLKLYKNGFAEIKSFIYALNPRTIPSLRRLILAQMLFPKIHPDDFETLKQIPLESLNLFTCKIEYIHPECFAEFSQLGVLGLGENNLNSSNIVEILRVIIKHGVPLQYLSLFDLGFKELPMKVLEVVAQTNVTHLSLSKNRFEIIETFPSMPKLERLDLSEVVALNITPGAFRLLPKLRTLYLNKNQFSEIPQAVLLPQLTYLDISYSGKYFSLQDEVFINMTNLAYLNLSGNNIRKLAYNTFYGLRGLKVLGLRESKLFFIDNETFVPTDRLLYLDLTGNPFPTRVLIKPIFDGLHNLEVLLLGNCQIAVIDAETELFSSLGSLRHLGLENNVLKSVPGKILEPLRRLEILDLSGNNFLSWDEPLFRNNSNLSTLILYDNKVRNITQAMIMDFLGLRSLDLHSNPFGCSCDDMSALNSIIYRKEYVVVFNLLHQHLLNCTYPEEYTNLTILDYLHNINVTQSCATPKFHLTPTAIVLTSMAILVLLTTIALVAMYRWHIRYWLFLARLLLSRASKPPKHQTHTTYDYDAFVSYSAEDQTFVRLLIGQLENQQPYYKLCVYERDFQIGTVISESVLEHLGRSRKTLLIVSDSYIRSQWCRWEVQVAENHRLFFENEYGECTNDSLVIIKLGEVCMRNVSPMLKYLMKTRIYLQWDDEPKKQKMFWEKLRASLSRPKTLLNYRMISA